MSLKFFSLALAAVATASPFDSMAKATNDDPYEACQPQGATGTTPPTVGTELSSLYIDILSSIQGISFDKRSVHGRADGFGCRQSLDCVNVKNINIPMCYDKFTTNFQFPDGSYGNVAAGTYSSGGTDVNLVSGDYTKDGQSANIYANNEAEKPNTSTLSVPAQYTGTGVGGAVPVTELGKVIVYTTTVPAVTYSAPTTVAETVETATISGVEVKTTVPATTVTQATTIAAKTNVVTQTPEASDASPQSTGAAGQVSVDTTRSFGMSVVGALLYALL
ncbi:hypothetical protein J4E93_006150 [Alternaria ventricosa]|uniref:uncharacterized protein n=1 Tax=Alternaria ventricosa TaxID=1187951 RepID=UPI0020C2C062|nr:uncharacterized protein J4E93_006150 [Alternaria ventricosa]KAI4644250.1 hypothetical protein J4E93_006150 [Alternaria ventricosa]